VKQETALLPLILNFVSECAIRKVHTIRRDWNRMEYINSWSMLMMLICQAETKTPKRNTVRG
jgi:hypothetical protein